MLVDAAIAQRDDGGAFDLVQLALVGRELVDPLAAEPHVGAIAIDAPPVVALVHESRRGVAVGLVDEVDRHRSVDSARIRRVDLDCAPLAQVGRVAHVVPWSLGKINAVPTPLLKPNLGFRGLQAFC